MKKIIFAFILFAASANAQPVTHGLNLETVTVSNSDFTVDVGQTHSLPIHGRRHVAKVVVQADGYSSDGMIEVVVNGDTKGTIHVPGRDPSYIVTVGEVTHSIEFRQISGGRVHVRKVQVVQSTTALAHRAGSGVGLVSVNQATDFARQAIELVNLLESYATLSDFTTYLMPIKVVAGRAYVMGSAHGGLSQRAWKALDDLLTQIEFASPYVTKAFQQDSIFELVIALETLKEQLKDVLR